MIKQTLTDICTKNNITKESFRLRTRTRPHYNSGRHFVYLLCSLSLSVSFLCFLRVLLSFVSMESTNNKLYLLALLFSLSYSMYTPTHRRFIILSHSSCVSFLFFISFFSIFFPFFCLFSLPSFYCQTNVTFFSLPLLGVFVYHLTFSTCSSVFTTPMRVTMQWNN